MSSNPELIQTDLQEHYAWERIGAGMTDEEKNTVLTIIYEVFALVVSHIQKLGKTEDISVDGAVQVMFKSRTQRESLRAAFVAPKFLKRLPAKAQASRKHAFRQEILSDLLPDQANIMDRSPEGDWINGTSISPAQFTLLQQHLQDQGVLEDGDGMWLCPVPMQELNLKQIESPQSGANCFPPADSQICYILVLLSTFLRRGPKFCLEEGRRTGFVDAEATLPGRFNLLVNLRMRQSKHQFLEETKSENKVVLDLNE
ncbi:hypothetical protein PoHVEF18_001904 [Penicillium ochrochloron]